ncbi:MAG: PIG-L family deacetylase [Actinomycetota bacterium]
MIVSPHLDDAVMSLGATIAAQVRNGVDVSVITVFAGNPDRLGPPSYWDARRAVPTASEAICQRRDEDLLAGKTLGVSVEWLPFDDAAYVSMRDPDAIWKCLEPTLSAADLILLPGWPLKHPDHLWTTMLVQERVDPEKAVAYYVELPYAARFVPFLKSLLRGRQSDAMHGHLKWARTATTAPDRRAKEQAVAAYAGELARLGYRARMAALHDVFLRKEFVGYLDSQQLPWALTLRR